MSDAAVRENVKISMRIKRRSIAFRILERLFADDRYKMPQTALNRLEQRVMKRLHDIGLVEISDETCANCGHPARQYAITVTGRACYLACSVGLSFSQLCYLACAKKVAENSFYRFSGLFPLTEVLNSPFGSVFLDKVTDKVMTWELARKGFLQIYAGRTASWGPRWQNLLAHQGVLDDLYKWLEDQDEKIISKVLSDPALYRLAPCAQSGG